MSNTDWFLALLMFITGFLLVIVVANTYIKHDVIDKFNELCINNEGIDSIRIPIIGTPEVTCKNGAKFTIKE
jgi:hypothetical protein